MKAYGAIAHTEPIPCTGSCFVLVCGLPGSGNRLLMRLFKAAGAESEIRHGNSGPKNINSLFDIHAGHDVRAVIPVRHWHAEHVSNEWTDSDEKRDEAVMVIMEILSARGIPTRMVSYESIFLYPNQTKDMLLEWAGLPKTDWPNGDEPRDENAKWECR